MAEYELSIEQNEIVYDLVQNELEYSIETNDLELSLSRVGPQGSKGDDGEKGDSYKQVRLYQNAEETEGVQVAPTVPQNTNGFQPLTGLAEDTGDWTTTQTTPNENQIGYRAVLTIFQDEGEGLWAAAEGEGWTAEAITGRGQDGDSFNQIYLFQIANESDSVPAVPSNVADVGFDETNGTALANGDWVTTAGDPAPGEILYEAIATITRRGARDSVWVIDVDWQVLQITGHRGAEGEQFILIEGDSSDSLPAHADGTTGGIAIGPNTNVNGNNGIALGDGATATANQLTVQNVSTVSTPSFTGGNNFFITVDADGNWSTSMVQAGGGQVTDNSRLSVSLNDSSSPQEDGADQTITATLSISNALSGETIKAGSQAVTVRDQNGNALSVTQDEDNSNVFTFDVDLSVAGVVHVSASAVFVNGSDEDQHTATTTFRVVAPKAHWYTATRLLAPTSLDQMTDEGEYISPEEKTYTSAANSGVQIRNAYVALPTGSYTFKTGFLNASITSEGTIGTHFTLYRLDDFDDTQTSGDTFIFTFTEA